MKKLSVLLVILALMFSGCEHDTSGDSTPWDYDVAGPTSQMPYFAPQMKYGIQEVITWKS